MKQNFYNEEERKEYLEFLNNVRNNTDIPRIYLPFIIGTSNIFSPISGCNVIDINSKVITGIDVIFKDTVSDKEKRDKIKEIINNFIDYAFDSYEIYKQEIGINKEAKVDRRKEVKLAKENIAKQETYNKISWAINNYNHLFNENIDSKINDIPVIVNINNKPIIISCKTNQVKDNPVVVYKTKEIKDNEDNEDNEDESNKM